MPGNLDTYHTAMNFGHSAAWDQQWDKAVSFYRQALDELPDDAAALTNLGLALFELHDYEVALRVYQRAAIVSPTDPLPLEKVARILERLGKVPEATQACMQSADLYLKNRDVEKAIENWMHTLSLQENLMARTRLAVVYERMGRKSDAVSEYIAAAAILQHSGDLVKAMQVAEYALQLMPDSLDAQQTLTLLRTNQALPRPNRPRGGTGPMLMKEVKQLDAPSDDSSSLDPIGEARQNALVQLAALLFDQAEEPTTPGQVSRRGIGSLTRGTGGLPSENGDRTRILLHLGQAIDSQTQGQEAQAAQELERALEAGLQHPAANYNLGLLLHTRDSAKGLRYLQLSVKHPDFALASFLLLGQIYRKEGNLKEAAVSYLQALCLGDIQTVPVEQAPDLEQIYEPFIESQRREGNPRLLEANCESISRQIIRPGWKQYLRLARQQLPQQPDDSPPLPLAEILLETHNSQVLEMLAHVRSLAAQNKLSSAMEEAYYALSQAPTYLPLHMQISDLLLKDGRIQDAVDKFMLVAELYSLRGEAPQAIRLLKRIIQIAPMDLTVRSRLIDLLLAQGHTEDGIQEYISLAEIYYQLAELDMARQTYATALRVAQQSHVGRAMGVQILYKMADIDLQHLDWRAALRVYEQIRTMDPEDTNARTELIDLNFRMGQDTAAVSEIDGYIGLLENSDRRERAVDFLKQVVDQRPDKIEARKRLADLYTRMQLSDKAVEQLDAVADILLANGNRAAALIIVQSIIALRPPNVKEYMRVLEQLKK